MKRLFVELGVEEIPSRMMEAGLERLEQRVRDWIEEQRLEPAEQASPELICQGTPRRLVIRANLRDQQRSEQETIKGPPEQVAYGDDGNPTRALEGFLDQHGLTEDEIEVRDVDSGRYVMSEQTRTGVELEECVRRDLEELILGLDWPKSMRWESTNVKFIRPIRWLNCLIDDELIEVEVGPVDSAPRSRGLRFTDREQFEVESEDEFDRVLDSEGIILDQDERRETIRDQVTREAKQVGSEADMSRSLLDQLTHLVEAPQAFVGEFSERFLEVPDVVLKKAMISHQMYVPVIDGDGELLPRFVGVRNGAEQGIEVVREGNEKVIRARLADAEFFYQKDREHPYESYREQLRGVVFQEELGSLFDKTERLAELVNQVETLGVELPEWLPKVARHAKNDLVTDMVEEFPDLQGTMGKIYAEQSGWESSHARVIEEHHQPDGRNAPVPESRPGGWLAILDRLDTLTGFYLIGERPSGSSDPYGLRRDTLGILRTMLQHEIPVLLPDLIAVALDRFDFQHDDSELVDTALREFFQERFRHYFQTQDHPAYRIRAGMDVSRWSPTACEVRLDWLEEYESDPDFQAVAEMAGRVRNIIESAERSSSGYDPEQFTEPEEQRLHEQISGFSLDVELQHQPQKSDLTRAVDELQDLVNPVNEFFEEIMVMADDRDLRQARLGLLGEIDDRLRELVQFEELDPIL